MNIDAPPHTPSTGRVGYYRVVVYPKRFRYVTWYFNMQGFEKSLKNAIAANLSAPPQPNSFLYPNYSASTWLGLQFRLYFPPGLLKHHLIHLGAAVV